MSGGGTSIPATIQSRITTWADPDGQLLRARQQEEIGGFYPGEPGNEPSALTVPVFVILSIDNVAVACGGIRTISNDTAEVKRMYVVPERRGKCHGVADVLMKELEQQAAERGWLTLRLETAKTMLSARKFYERHEYREIPAYGEFDGSVFYEKTLERVILPS